MVVNYRYCSIHNILYILLYLSHETDALSLNENPLIICKLINCTKNTEFNKYFSLFQKMKTEDKNNMPKVRIAVIGKSNVGKSGKNNS